MKRKKHIPVLLFAAFFAMASNGVSFYKHFCNTIKSASYSLVSAPSCEMEIEKKEAACCSKKASTANTHSDCCEHKTFFKKFSFEGFTAKFFTFGLIDLVHIFIDHIRFEIPIPVLHDFFTGLSPPGPEYEIAQYLVPTQPELQVFIC